MGQVLHVLHHRFRHDPHRIIVQRQGLFDGQFEQIIERAGVLVGEMKNRPRSKIRLRRGIHPLGGIFCKVGRIGQHEGVGVMGDMKDGIVRFSPSICSANCSVNIVANNVKPQRSSHLQQMPIPCKRVEAGVVPNVKGT